MRPLVAFVVACCVALPAHAFSFKDEDGRGLTLADFAGKVVLLDLWATWCAPCIQELPQLEALHRDLGPRGLAVVAVSIDRGGLPKVRLFRQRSGLEALPIYLDEERALPQALGVAGIPAAFLYDRAGRLVARLEGPHDWTAERGRLEALLDQAP